MTSTPWGQSDYSKSYGRGIVFYGTPGHGGFHVSPTLNARIPEPFRKIAERWTRRPGWYEEDCDYAMVVVTFPERFPDMNVADCWATIRNYYPDAYEAVTGKTLQPGESRARDEQLFRAAHVNDYIAVSAWGDWHEMVPAGFVGVRAERESDGDEQYFLIPAAEYRATVPGMLIDLSKHQPWLQHA